MGCLRVKELNEYLIDPLTKGLNDKNSYVRKTAVLCVPKVYEISPELVKRADMIQTLQNLLQEDQNSMVVCNALQALNQISELSQEKYITWDDGTLKKLLTLLNEAFEWGQIYILDSLVQFQDATPEQAEL